MKKMITIFSFILLFAKTKCVSNEEILQDISKNIPLEFGKVSPTTPQINYIDKQSLISLTIFSIKPIMLPKETTVHIQNNTIIYHNTSILLLFNTTLYINPIDNKAENTLIITKQVSSAELFFDSIIFKTDLNDNHTISLTEPSKIMVDFTPWDQYVYLERILFNNENVIKNDLYLIVNKAFDLMLQFYPMGEAESIFLHIIGFIQGYNEFQVQSVKDVIIGKLRNIEYEKVIRKGTRYAEFLNISLEVYYYNRNGKEFHEYLKCDKVVLTQKKISFGLIIKGGVMARTIAEDIFNISYAAIEVI